MGILLVAVLAGLAWHEHGSPTAKDWLKYGLLAGIRHRRHPRLEPGDAPRPPALLALAALGGTAILATISITYTAVPNLARDEALLTVLYAAVFAVPALMLRTREDRIFATAFIVAGSGLLAVFAALALVMRSQPELLFYGGRLNFPITYPNGQAAAMLIGYWPALALASRRSGALWLRALALGGATAMLCGWLLTQSKGGAIGLIASTIVVFAVSERRLRLLLPWAITLLFAAIGAVPLTAPIRTSTTPALRAAIHHGGAVLLWLTVAATAAGAVYVLADRKLEISGATRTMLSRVALVGVIVTLVGIPGWLLRDGRGPGALRLQPVPRLQEGARHRELGHPPAHPRLEPLRLLAGRAGRVRRPPAGWGRLPRIRLPPTSRTGAAWRPRRAPIRFRSTLSRRPA